MRDYPRQPTSDECSENATWTDGHMNCMALWYPQMGGYVGKCVITYHKGEGCFDAYVWHDGEFAFDNRSPAVLHHCDPDQFIKFGQTIKSITSNVLDAIAEV